MIEIFEWLGNAYQAYRAAHDAGIWFFQMNAPYIQNYMESSLIEKGRL